MRIAVYTIAKNEEAFVQRWFDSAKEADHLLILDTGSTDNTTAQLATPQYAIKATRCGRIKYCAIAPAKKVPPVLMSGSTTNISFCSVESPIKPGI